MRQGGACGGVWGAGLLRCLAAPTIRKQDPSSGACGKLDKEPTLIYTGEAEIASPSPPLPHFSSSSHPFLQFSARFGFVPGREQVESHVCS